MKKEIQLSVPNLDMDIVENLRECVETGWVSTGGRFISEFEKKIAEYAGTENAVSCQSGTAGLHTALRILGVQAGDEVIVPTLTFIAAINPIAYIGAFPVFMDCNEYFCMDADKLRKFCSEECELKKAEKQETQGNEHGGKKKILINRKTGRQVKVVIPVHIFGNMADMEEINDIAEEYGLSVLEDATEAFGSYYTEGRFAGKYAGTLGALGVYSFNANKIITTGGGGMIISNNKEYLDEARYLTITAKETSPEEALYFVHNEVGYNYRMLNIQAAFGVSQIERLEEFISIKERNFKKYQECLADTEGLTLMPFTPGIRSNMWFYSLYVDKEKFGESRDELMYRLIANGVQCRPVWKLSHTQKPYAEMQSYKIEKAYDYEKNVLNMPCSTNLTEEDVEYVCNMIKGR